MRICHVLETSGGGSGQVVVDLARYAAEQGHAVTVIYSPTRAEERFRAKITALKNLVTAELPMKRAVGLSDIVGFIKLFRLIKSLGPFDIIHAHSSKAGALVRAASLFLPGKVVYTPHCFYSMAPGASRIYSLIERLLSFLPSAIAVVSAGEHAHALEIGIKKSRLSIVKNGTDIEESAKRDAARAMIAATPSDFVVGFIGRLESQKNPMRAIGAFELVLKTHEHARLVVVGDGILRAALEETVERDDLSDKVTFLGGVPARMVISGFDCLLCSSDFEGMPIIFLEAAASGVPIVSTPVGGADEMIVQGRTGLVAETFEEAGLASVLSELMNMKSECRDKMSQSGIELSRKYSSATMGGEYIELYRKISGSEIQSAVEELNQPAASSSAGGAT